MLQRFKEAGDVENRLLVPFKEIYDVLWGKSVKGVNSFRPYPGFHYLAGLENHRRVQRIPGSL
jgi:hypothetical protein